MLHYYHHNGLSWFANGWSMCTKSIRILPYVNELSYWQAKCLIHFHLIFVCGLDVRNCSSFYAENSVPSKYIELPSSTTANLLLEFYVIGSSECNVRLSPVANPNQTDDRVYHIRKCMFLLARFSVVFAIHACAYINIEWFNCKKKCSKLKKDFRFQWLVDSITHALSFDKESK